MIWTRSADRIKDIKGQQFAPICSRPTLSR